jgi:hypothetical protein
MPSSKSTRNRYILLARIYIRGIIIIFRYARYLPDKLNYIRSEDFLSCLRCIQRGLLYKIESFSKSDFAKINKERARLDAEEDKTNEEIITETEKI